MPQIVLSSFFFSPWCWLNAEKYALLDKLKASKSIPYMEQEGQNLGAGSINQKLCKLPRGREHSSGSSVCELGKFASCCTQLALLWQEFYKKSLSR